MTNQIERVIEENNDNLERRHREDFKEIARAMESEEKYIVLKTIPTNVLLDELKKRFSVLEERDTAIKALFKM